MKSTPKRSARMLAAALLSIAATATAQDTYDWDSLDDDPAATEGSGEPDAGTEQFDWDALEEESESDEEFDWESFEGDEDTEDWDSYWDELDAAEEPVESVEVPTEVAPDTGGIAGRVVDAETGGPFPRAAVTLSGTGLETLTDADGRFYFEVVPGTYTVRVEHFELHAVSYQVLVEPGDITDLAEIRMVPSDNQATIVVEGRAVTESNAQQLLERQDSSTVQDAIGAEEISRAGDSSAGAAVRRVVGVTLVDDRFLVVRGLGGRYNQVTLNGVPVPRTDPDYPSAEVDIFPTDLLSSLTLEKNPAAASSSFVGGLMDIETRSYPEELELRLSASLGGSHTTTFRDFRSVAGGRLDALGFDDGTRALPDGLPTDELLDRRTTDDYEALARAFPDEWDPRTTVARPNTGLKLSLGNTLELGERRLGYLLMAGYDNALVHRSATRGNPRLAGGDLVIAEELHGDSYEERATWGTLGNVSLEVADGHDLRLVSMWNHTARDSFSVWQGRSDEEGGADLERTTRQWLQRSLVFNQLLGSHRRLLPESSPWHELRADWTLSASVARRLEPDTRTHKELDGSWVQNPGTGEHFTSDLDQTDVFGSFELTMPYLDTFSATAGGSTYRVHRDFQTRRFRYQLGSDPDPTLRDLGPEEAFADANLTAAGDQVVLREWTGRGDGYAADQWNHAGFASVEVAPVEWLRLVAGARYEVFVQELRDEAIGQEPGTGDDVHRTEGDLLPSGAAVFEVTDGMFVRAVYGAAVARPQVREIAPFVYQDYVRRRTVTGNPDLIRTYVHNADLRWEWFPSPTEVVAASVFYKEFMHPIEATVANPQGDVVYLNADGATNFGAELEAQLDLGRLGSAARGLSLGANIALVHSRIDLPCPDESGDGECDYAFTNRSRPMEGQANVQANARLGWELADTGFSANLVYSLLGSRIADVGTSGLPDARRLTEHRLDLTSAYAFDDHWRLSLKIRNLAAGRVREAVGDVRTYDERVPTEFSLSATWSY